MKLFLNKFLMVLVFSIFSGSAIAADDLIISKSLWKNAANESQLIKKLIRGKKDASLRKRSLKLDEIGLESILNKKKSINKYSFSTQNLNVTNKIIQLPLPDGTEVSVGITPSSVMSASLAKKFPKIKTWNVKGIDEDITGTIDFTHRGFHGMLVMPDGDRVFIEPDFDELNINDDEFSSKKSYNSFSKNQNSENVISEFSCGVINDQQTTIKTAARTETAEVIPALDLITYRLAIAATGEYTQASGGTVASALSRIVTTVNRVNEIYARDLGIVFELIDEQNDIIYLDPDTDPYGSFNFSIDNVISQNNQNLSDSGVLSKDKYDIGHVFGVASGNGLAVVGGVCNDNEKAFGATSYDDISGDAFAIDFFAHELGHQLGASHTFNSICGVQQRIGDTAVEPGSGSTIMAYAGICLNDNIQDSSDAQFHVASINQIVSLTRDLGTTGSSCGIRTVTGNQNPTVNAGEDITVPARTPIMLAATGEDADNDDLTYSWEQSDTGTASKVNVDTGDNAIFRSRPITTDSTRYIPRLSDLFTGSPSNGEFLPVTNRNIEMVVTIRDGKGGFKADLVNLNVSDTGEPFYITSHVNDQSFGREASTEIKWDVADTNLPPISCANVDIGLITSDANIINIMTTANDGQEQIIIPGTSPAINDARFIVSCSDNIFFNVSSGHITILDQVGGGVIGAARTIEPDLFIALESVGDGTTTDDEENTTDEDSGESSGSGGTFGMFLLFWSLMLIFTRREFVK